MERKLGLLSDMQNPTPLGVVLREARMSKSMSGRKVAGLAGISPAYLLVLENGKNPKTGKVSIPSPEIKSRLFSVLSIADDVSESTNSAKKRDRSRLEKIIKELDTMSILEREKAAKMVRDGLVYIDSPNNIFSYSLELAKVYGDTSVVMRAVIEELEKKIAELENKYKIEEVNNE